MLSTIGVDGLLKLMVGVEDRTCGFDACVVYIAPSGQEHVFREEQTYFGTMTHQKRASCREGEQVGAAWGKQGPKELFAVFAPGDLGDAGIEAGITEGSDTRRNE